MKMSIARSGIALTTFILMNKGAANKALTASIVTVGKNMTFIPRITKLISTFS